ncbi:protein NLP7-like [Lycium barbarum]|uniref:protein NLP7-like n=1 Tax=Lycium barbarum TaxID=112863 RepID=UPI00293E64B9|nr:protein NLP7-like [Lycium barbarum]
MAEQLQIQEFVVGEEEKECTTIMDVQIESPVNLYNLDYCYLNLPPISPLADIVLSPLWSSSDCNDTGCYDGSSISAIRRISNDQHFSSHSASYPDGSPGDVDRSLRKSPAYEKASSLDFCNIKKRISQAVEYILSMGEDILVQFWAPVKTSSQCILATCGQPFAIDSTNSRLHHYRMISVMYYYSVDGTNDGCLGLPGRVFKMKFPEWTPNVKYYSSKEFPQLDHALLYNIRGTLALPVFEGDRCVGVLELIMTSEKINYAPEFDKVCKALEATNLKSTETFDQRDTLTCNEDFKNTQVEILELLSAVCERHKLPLAQTWLPFSHQNAVICGNRFTGLTCGPSFAFYVVEAHMWAFREACLEHLLQDKQGLPGKAFSSLDACFCPDISLFGKSEYPLAHYARMFGLQSSLAIPVYSSLSREETCVLEFFLPHSSTDQKMQLQIAVSILATTREILQNSKVMQWMEPKVEGHFKIIDLSVGKKLPFAPVAELKSQTVDTRHGLLASPGGLGSKEQDLPMQQMPEYDIALFKATSDANAKKITSSILENDEKKTSQVLRQLFGRNLNDAANCLGVSRSTFKRICRQQGISRWPRMKKSSSNCFDQIREHVNEAAHLVEKASTGTSWPVEPMLEFGSNSSTNLKKPIHHGLLLQQIESTTFTSGNLAKEMPNEKSNSVTLSNFGVLVGTDKRVPESSGSVPQNSCPPLAQLLASIVDVPRSPPVTALQNGETAIIKVRYGEYIIRFRLSFSSQFGELENKVADRLELKIGTFRIQYQDTDDDWVLITCNDDLESCLSEWRSVGNRSIKMLVQTINL